MGRIEKAIEKARQSEGSVATSQPKRGEFRRAGSTYVDSMAKTIDFARLPNMIPDPDCLVKNRIVAAQIDSPMRSTYKMLRTRVLQRLRSSKWNVIGVSGTGPGEGKTMTAVNLAYSLAQDVNHRVVLIDLDLRRPSIHHYLGLKPKNDLTSFLKGTAELKNILVRPNEKRLALMTNQTTYRDSSEILSSPELGKLINQLRDLGPKTITIVDLPPVLAGDDVLAFAPLVDALLLVVAQGTCRREYLAESQELLKDFNTLGVILNRSRDRTATGGYYDYY